MYNILYQDELSAAVYVIAILITIFFYLLLAVGYMGIFRKADQPSWAAFVPLYNSYILNKIAFGNGWFFLIGLLPAIGKYSKSDSLSLLFSLIGFLYTIFLSNRIATVFDKSKLFTVGLIFLPFIFYPILGLGSSYYAGQYASGGSFLSTGRSKDFSRANITKGIIVTILNKAAMMQEASTRAAITHMNKAMAQEFNFSDKKIRLPAAVRMVKTTPAMAITVTTVRTTTPAMAMTVITVRIIPTTAIAENNFCY